MVDWGLGCATAPECSSQRSSTGFQLLKESKNMMGVSRNMLRGLKQLIPPPLKRAVKETRFKWKLRRAFRRIANLPPGQIPTAEMLVDLQIAWGNEGYAARTDFLQEVAERAVITSGPILECGSGLTTILFGLLAGRRG